MNRYLPAVAAASLWLAFSPRPSVAVDPAAAPDCSGGSYRAVLQLEAEGNYGCLIVPAFPVLVDVNVVATYVPISKIRFSLPDPPFGTLAGEVYHFPYVGDRVNGIEMDVSGCSGPGGTILATLTVVSPTGTIGLCQDWRVDDGCETIDCNGFTQPAWSMHESFSDPVASCPLCDNWWQECVAMPPYALDPPCDAADVPVDVQLSWSGTAPLGKWWLLIGTDPGLAGAQQFWLDAATFAPDFLLSGTRYYWQVAADLTGEACNGGVSAIHSFTTEGPTAVAHESWGSVKALYR